MGSAMGKSGADAWETLRNYESSELVRDAFQKRHGLDLNSGKAREICTAITQARNYMAAASAADRNVRPLLAYYGVLAMSRGLILFLSRTLRENGLSQAHGLTISGWGEELAKEAGDVARLCIKINTNGTLPQLIEATERASFLRNNSSAPNFTSVCAPIPADGEATLVDLLSRIPEVRSTFVRWRAERNAVSIWPQGKQPDGRLHLRIDSPYEKEDVTAVFGDVATLVSEEGRALTYSVPADIAPYVTDWAGPPWDIGTLVALRKMPAGLELSKLAMAFTTSYALGMLVRYYPSHWISMLQNVRHDAALPTLLAALQHIENDVPRLVVEFLEKVPDTTSDDE